MVEDSPSIIDRLHDAVEALQHAGLDELADREVLVLMRDLEVVRRRLDAGTDRLVDRCDVTKAFQEDGHRSTKPCVKHLGRLSGREAHGRVQTARVLRELPAVAAAYAAGQLPTESVRAIARVAANPRVKQFLAIADEVFAEKAATEGYDGMASWMRQWEDLADADGAAAAADRGHERRRASLHPTQVDDTWHLESDAGSLQGAVMADIFAAFVEAELEADIAEAKDTDGEDWTIDRLPRTHAQRRQDAVFAIFRRAMAQPAGASDPTPLVNIVIDEETLVREIRRAAGDREATDDPARVDDAICHTSAGTPLRPSDVLAAFVVGHVRRVVVDATSNVIDLGRRRRLFTGSARDAAFLRALLRDRGSTGCAWPACDTHHRRLQVDHLRAYARGGATSPGNSGPKCGVHNRLKEHGFRPVRCPDGSWVILRPDDSSITPSA